MFDMAFSALSCRELAKLAVKDLTGLLEMDSQKVLPAPVQVLLPLSKCVQKLLTRKRLELNPKGLGNIPSDVPG